MSNLVTGPKIYCWSGSRRLVIAGCEPVEQLLNEVVRMREAQEQANNQTQSEGAKIE